MESPNKLPLYRGKRPTQTTDLLLQSNARELSLSLKYLSSLNRFNVNSKVRARQYISDTFRSFGLNVTEQKFKAPYIEVSHRGELKVHQCFYSKLFSTTT